MEEYIIDFSGYCTIKANGREDAQSKFWRNLQAPSSEAYDEIYDIDGIEGPGTEEEIRREEERLKWLKNERAIEREADLEEELEMMLDGFFCSAYGDYETLCHSLLYKSVMSGDVFRWYTPAARRMETRILMMKYKGPYRTI